MLVSAEIELIFFVSGWYGFVFWICAEHRIDTIETFLVLLSRAQQKAFSAFLTAILVRKLGVHGWLGGDIARTGDPN